MKLGRSYFYILVILMLGLFSGCSSESVLIKEEINFQDKESQSNQLSCTIEEILLPDLLSKQDLMLDEDEELYEKELVLYEEDVYLKINIMEGEDTWTESFWLVLKPPYTEWQLVADTPIEIEGKSYQPLLSTGLLFSESDRLYTTLFYKEDDENFYFLGTLEEKGVEEVLCSMPEIYRMEERLHFDKAGHIYDFQALGSQIDFLDSELQYQKSVNLPGSIMGILQADSESDTYWYGYNENDKVTVRNLVNGEILLDDFEGVSPYSYEIDLTEANRLYVADSQTIWQIDEEPLLLCDFLKRDYIVDELYGITADEEDGVMALVTLDGDYTLLKIRESEAKKTEKQEIVLACLSRSVGLERSIARFNRQSEQYHISVMVPETNESYAEFRDRVRIQISIGKGPDIMDDGTILDVASYVENDYLECMDGIIEDTSQYVNGALEAGYVAGNLYGIVYEYIPEFAVYSQELTRGRASWTIEEFMESVEASGAKILERYVDGTDIVKWYGLYDDSSTAYIDWEKGESYLTEEPFLRLLAFAKKYGDTNEIQRESGELIALGEAVVYTAWMYDMQMMNMLEACFAGEPAMIGYPRQEGLGIHADCRMLYGSSSSNYKEGVKEFLRYLISEEGQCKYIDYSLPVGESVEGSIPFFPVHLGAYEKLMELAQKDMPKGYGMIDGIYYDRKPLTNEQVEQIYFLVENIHSGNFNAKAIDAIVEEELAPYFAGDITAKQAAEILDNRVQLYLDERIN